jgi:hypothetical protein
MIIMIVIMTTMMNDNNNNNKMKMTPTYIELYVTWMLTAHLFADMILNNTMKTWERRKKEWQCRRPKRYTEDTPVTLKHQMSKKQHRKHGYMLAKSSQKQLDIW